MLQQTPRLPLEFDETIDPALNTDRLEGGRFGRSAIRHRRSFGPGPPSCAAMECVIRASVRGPEATATEPRAQNRLRRCAHSGSRSRERMPVRHWTIGRIRGGGQ
jgi:hypothetical protein